MTTQITPNNIVTGSFTTDIVVEAGNLYFNNTRAVSALTGGNSIVIDANGLITALASGLDYTVSESPPSNPNVGDVWLKQSTGEKLEYFNDGDSFQWVELNSSNKLVEDSVDTDQVSEGTTNLYFTNTRSFANLLNATTTSLSEGDNLYFTNTRSFANLLNATTTSLSEGTNLYFTNTRAVSAFTGGANIAIDANGLITSQVEAGGGGASLTRAIAATLVFS